MTRPFGLPLVGLWFWIVPLLVHADSIQPEKGYIGIAVSPGKNAGYPTITYLATDSPAAKAGIKEGDDIVIVNGIPVRGLSPIEVMPLIDGNTGSTVEIVLRRGGSQEIQVSVLRQPLLDTYLAAANAGDAKAEFHLGYFYEFGPPAARDLPQAAEWYRKAADQGYAPAQTDLGYMYNHGLGVTKDEETAVAWYLKSAQQGDTVAERDLALGYLQGKGIRQSDQDAFDWFCSAARQDDPTAEEYLGYLYREGRGVTRDDRASFAWYYRSAQRNDPYGEENLASLYERGRGVSQDSAEALKWYLKAQASLPESKSLKGAIAITSLRVFLENRDSGSKVDLSLLLTAFRKEILVLFGALTLGYLVGGVTLLHLTFRTPDVPKLPVALGWTVLYLESQGVAFLGLCLLGRTVSADVLVGTTAFFCAVPVIISSCGPSWNRIWRPSIVSWKFLIFYGVGAYAAMALIGFGYEKAYAWIVHAPLPSQPTWAIFGKAKDASLGTAYLAVAFLLPMAEEIIFRGYLFGALRRRFSGKIVVIITALIFALIHFQRLYFVPLVGFGLILGWIRLKTDSLRLPVLLHAINNAVSLALAV